MDDSSTKIRYEDRVSKRIGIKRIVNRMGSEDLVVARRIELFQGYRDADRCVRGSLERSKTKNKTTKTGESRCLENSPSNKLPVLKGWLMFKEQDPSNDRHNNRLKARKCCLCRDKGSITC
jgi:hypothetical protein